MCDRKRLLPLFALLALLLGACEVVPTAEPTIPFPTFPPASPEPTAVPPPTVPTVQPTPTPKCVDRASFDSDVTVPPGTAFLPGTPFVKTWRLRNIGTCTWSTDYVLLFYSGNRMAGAALVPLPTAVPPDSTVDLSVALVAPAGTGTYEGRWVLRNADGDIFGIAESVDGSFAVRIVVEATLTPPTATPVPPTATPVPTAGPSPTPTPVITAWRGEYFANPDLSGNPALVRNDTAIDFDWGLNAPASGLPADGFSVRWTRVLTFTAGPHRFFAEVDDGVRLWVDDHLVLADWNDGAQREVSADWTVRAGAHTVRVEYYDRAGQGVIRVRWTNFLAIFPDWEGQYWINANLSGAPFLVQNEPWVDFDWGDGPVAVGMPVDNFSARWMRVVKFEAGTYRFHVLVDDGARLWVDGNLLIDSWRDGTVRELTADMALTAGEHVLWIEYYERSGNARIRVWWDKL